MCGRERGSAEEEEEEEEEAGRDEVIKQEPTIGMWWEKAPAAARGRRNGP